MMVNEFNTTEWKGGVTELLREICSISFLIETNTSIYNVMDEAKSIFYTYRKDEGESHENCLRQFKSVVEVTDHC